MQHWQPSTATRRAAGIASPQLSHHSALVAWPPARRWCCARACCSRCSAWSLALSMMSAMGAALHRLARAGHNAQQLADQLITMRLQLSHLGTLPAAVGGTAGQAGNKLTLFRQQHAQRLHRIARGRYRHRLITHHPIHLLEPGTHGRATHKLYNARDVVWSQMVVRVGTRKALLKRAIRLAKDRANGLMAATELPAIIVDCHIQRHRRAARIYIVQMRHGSKSCQLP